MHNIKELRPQTYSRFQQGYIKNDACKKLFPSLRKQPIIFRSSYERKFVYWLESNKNVKHWGSECVSVPYMYIDGVVHTYYPDYFVEMENGDKILVEIKPKNQTIKPLTESGYVYDMWVKNMCKWKAAKKFCEDRNIKFQIITEQTIERL